MDTSDEDRAVLTYVLPEIGRKHVSVVVIILTHYCCEQVYIILEQVVNRAFHQHDIQFRRQKVFAELIHKQRWKHGLDMMIVSLVKDLDPAESPMDAEREHDEGSNCCGIQLNCSDVLYCHVAIN